MIPVGLTAYAFHTAVTLTSFILCKVQSVVFGKDPRPHTGGPGQENEIKIAVCTSALQFNIQSIIERLQKTRSSLVQFEFLQLPYNDLDSYRLRPGTFDGLILCHSIHNRRFAITDVLDALYDNFLPHVKDVMGKGNVCVVVHDFTWPLQPSSQQSSRRAPEDHITTKKAHMESFRIGQPTTFQCCALAMICGRLDDALEMDKEDIEQLTNFAASVHHDRPIARSHQGLS